MRGVLAKRIRQHVRDKYPYLSPTPMYRKHRGTGQLTLAQQCQRALVQSMKKQYKKRRMYGPQV